MECNIPHSDQNKKLSSGAGSDKLGDLIILGLSYKATESDVKEYFEGYGEIKSCEVCYSAIFLVSREKSRARSHVVNCEVTRVRNGDCELLSILLYTSGSSSSISEGRCLTMMKELIRLHV